MQKKASENDNKQNDASDKDSDSSTSSSENEEEVAISEPVQCDNCTKNYEGSSGGMESTGAEKMFSRSRNWFNNEGVIYHTVVRDRDSDLMFKIRFLYEDLGMCDICSKFIGVPASDKIWKKFRLVGSRFT